MWQEIKLATIPRSLRYLLGLTAVLILALNIYILIVGFRRPSYDVWIASGGYLLGVVLPAVVVMLLVQFSHSGIRALQDRTREVLTGLIPDQLTLTADCFRSLPSWSGSNEIIRVKAEVATHFLRGECWADYELKIPLAADGSARVRLLLRLEVNVRYANVDLFVPAAIADAHCSCDGDGSHDDSQRLAVLRKKFEHTLAGAEGAGYRVNTRVVRRRSGDRAYDCIVLARELAANFLWDSAEKLWFAQDLMFMVRAFAQENPAAFEGDSETDA